MHDRVPAPEAVGWPDKSAEATSVVPTPGFAQVDQSAEKREEPAEPSEDHVQDVDSERVEQSKRMKLSDEVSMVAGLHVSRLCCGNIKT